jgi:hypothetical protein
MNEHDRLILKAMTTYGGQFVKALSYTCLVADSNNFERLKAAFQDVFKSYEQFIPQTANQTATAQT